MIIEPIGFLSFAPASAGINRADRAARRDWHAQDENDKPLTVTTAGDGTLEIRHGNGDDEEPDQIKLQAPYGEGNAGGLGENAPGFETRMAAALAPAKNADQENPASIRGLSALLTSHYRRR
jgi:hypothetical protein